MFTFCLYKLCIYSSRSFLVIYLLPLTWRHKWKTGAATRTNPGGLEVLTLIPDVILLLKLASWRDKTYYLFSIHSLIALRLQLQVIYGQAKSLSTHFLAPLPSGLMTTGTWMTVSWSYCHSVVTIPVKHQGNSSLKLCTDKELKQNWVSVLLLLQQLN